MIVTAAKMQAQQNNGTQTGSRWRFLPNNGCVYEYVMKRLTREANGTN